MNDEIVIKYRITTPMFIGGANQNANAELRAPSIKGVLRFWYRAIDSEYRKHEMRIFGGSGKTEGQASFLLRVNPVITSGVKAALGPKTKYLAYGTTNENNQQRPYIQRGRPFTLRIIFKPKRQDQDEEEFQKDKRRLKRALWAMTMFGGLGARSRKGFGSFMATEAHGMEELPSLMPEITKLAETIKEFIDTHIHKDPAPLPEHSSWSERTRCVVTGVNNTKAIDTLEWLGEQIHELRSTQGSNIFAWPAEDCAKMRQFSEKGTSPASPPLRAAFGLPHNYYFSDLKNKNVDLNKMDGNQKGRRASPLLFHIYEKANKACVIATFLPARLVPDGERITLTASRKAGNKTITAYTTQMTLPDNFQAIEDILDKFKTTKYQGQEVT